jgi:hypothetical protein
MSNDKEKEIQYRLKVLSQIEPKGQAAQKAIEKVREVLTRTQKTPAGKGIQILRFIFSIQTIKFATAAVILLGVGFIAGRLAIPKQADVINMAEIQTMVDKKCAETAEKTLAASSTLMDQRMNKIIGLVEAARETDRQWIAAAFDKIENDRRIDNTRVGNSLIAIAAWTKEINPNEQN